MKKFIGDSTKFNWDMTVSMQFLIDEIERVQLYNHNQTEFLTDVKEIVGKHILNWVEIEVPKR